MSDEFEKAKTELAYFLSAGGSGMHAATLIEALIDAKIKRYDDAKHGYSADCGSLKINKSPPETT